MDSETIAGAVLLLVLLAVAFCAGYGWRLYIEWYRRNRPWLKYQDEINRRVASERREELKKRWHQRHEEFKTRWRRLLHWLMRRGTVGDEQD
jgi:hypothetical protein